MEKKCFIILSPIETAGYPKGHFNRVYQYIIAAACRQAGFNPIRLGDPDMDDTPFGILNIIIESEHVICDMSANNKHSLYTFAIRQSLGLPVTLIKDIKTSLNANIAEFEVMEYDESLRIDTVEIEVPALAEMIKKAYEGKSEPDYTLTRLNVMPPEITDSSINTPYSTPEIDTIDKPEKNESHLPFITPIPDYVGEPLNQTEIDKLSVGDFFFHMNYGKGKIITINKQTKDNLMKIQFEDNVKVLVLSPSQIFRKISSN